MLMLSIATQEHSYYDDMKNMLKTLWFEWYFFLV